MNNADGNITNSSLIIEDPSYSLNDQLHLKIIDLINAIRQWKLWLFAFFLGLIGGAIYAFFTPQTFTARTSFVVEDSKNASGGIASAVAGQLGIDLGGLSGTSGVLAGDNVLELLKSKSLIKKTLLSKISANSNQTIADLYIEQYGWKDKWERDSKVNRIVRFGRDSAKYTRQEDSLLQIIIKRISEQELSVNKPDRKLGFFEMLVNTRSEELSTLISAKLLKTATDFYIETKTRRLYTNVRRLQIKADSLERGLNLKTYYNLDANKLLLNANPAYLDPSASAEISAREKLLNATIFAEIVKQLEINKTTLIQETPTVQIVDEPELPIKENNYPNWVLIILGGMIGGATLIGWLTFFKNDRQRIKRN